MNFRYAVPILLAGSSIATVADAFAPIQQKLKGTSTILNDLKKLDWKSPSNDDVERWLQSYGEQSRRKRRDVFTANDWVKSRRPERFIETVLTTFDSSLTQVVWEEVAVVGVIASFVILYNGAVSKGFDFGAQHFDPVVAGLFPLTLPLAPFNLCSGALGLLLTFRTNVSYQRWNEARTAWGKVINDSRSIARMGCIWAKSYRNIDNESLRKLGDAICSFSRSLMNRTLPVQEDGENFKRYCRERILDKEYAELLMNAKHRPTCALAQITSILTEFQLNPIHQVEADRVVTGLCDALGASERIFTSPVPTFYPRFTARFLAWWLMFLPLALYDVLGGTWNHLGLLPVSCVLSAFLLGIEELATEMEEPFSILPMEKMCEGSIRTPVMEQVERSQRGIQAGFISDGWQPTNPPGAPIREAFPVAAAPIKPAPLAAPQAKVATPNTASQTRTWSSLETFLKSHPGSD